MIGFRQTAARAAAVTVKGIALAHLALGMASAAAPDLKAMNEPHKPFKIYGNTYYVGTAGISSVLVTSDYGHVLVDGGLPESAPLIAKNIQELGFKLEDVKAIVFSHAHVDHVGGIAELQRLTGAQVYALRPAEPVLRTGKLQKDDPQAAAKSPAIPKVERVWVATDGQLLGVGGVRLRVYATPGHTPGSATWTWDACEGTSCLAFVYADSMNPVSAGKYRFRDHPEVVESFEQSLKLIEGLRCQILLTPHPDADTLQKLEQANNDPKALEDAEACKRFAQQKREALQNRLAQES
jgi:metallo-beta-lactamase class B